MPVQSIRKLIRMGKNGLVVTVPRAWANYYNLKAGDKVNVVADDHLTIRPYTESNESRNTSEACQHDLSVEQKLSAGATEDTSLEKRD